MQNLVAAGLLAAGDRLTSTNSVWPANGSVLVDGRIEVDGVAHSSPSTAAYAVKGGHHNGWEFWAVDTPTGTISLATLRARYADEQQPSSTV